MTSALESSSCHPPTPKPCWPHCLSGTQAAAFPSQLCPGPAAGVDGASLQGPWSLVSFRGLGASWGRAPSSLLVQTALGLLVPEVRDAPRCLRDLSVTSWAALLMEQTWSGFALL